MYSKVWNLEYSKVWNQEFDMVSHMAFQLELCQVWQQELFQMSRLVLFVALFLDLDKSFDSEMDLGFVWDLRQYILSYRKRRLEWHLVSLNMYIYSDIYKYNSVVHYDYH